jgi:hypothetical protein
MVRLAWRLARFKFLASVSAAAIYRTFPTSVNINTFKRSVWSDTPNTKNIPPHSLNMFVVQNIKKREIDKPLFATSSPTFLQSPHSAMTKHNFSYVSLMTNFKNSLSQTVMKIMVFSTISAVIDNLTTLYQVQQIIQPSLFSVYDGIHSASDVNGLHMWLNLNVNFISVGSRYYVCTHYLPMLFNSRPTDIKSQYVTDRLPSRNSSQVNPPFQITYVIEFLTAHIIEPFIISSLCCVFLFLSATLYFDDPIGRAV